MRMRSAPPGGRLPAHQNPMPDHQGVLEAHLQEPIHTLVMPPPPPLPPITTPGTPLLPPPPLPPVTAPPPVFPSPHNYLIVVLRPQRMRMEPLRMHSFLCHGKQRMNRIPPLEPLRMQLLKVCSWDSERRHSLRRSWEREIACSSHFACLSISR